MRKGLLLVLMMNCVTVWTLAQQCLPTGITFASQQEIDDFASNYPGCTSIQGNVTIRRTSLGPITSLAGLSQLNEIGGYLLIDETISLTNLTGLDNLTHVYGNLAIYNNVGLESLAGLDNLELVGGDFRLIGNAALTTLDGLAALTQLGGEIHIAGQEYLTSLAGLASITTVPGRLRLVDNYGLTDLNGLENLVAVGEGVEITSSTLLNDISQLQNLTTVGGDVNISVLPIATLAGLEGLTQINGSLSLNHLPNIENLDPIAGISTILGGFSVNYLPLVERLFENSSLTSIGGAFYVSNNDQLLDMSGLENLESVGSFQISGNENLINFTGLAGLTGVEHLFTVLQNNSLQNCVGLDNLTTIGGRVLFASNPALVDLTGLSSLTTMGSHLEIDNNDAMVNLMGMSALNAIGGYLLVEKNATMLNLAGLEGITTITDDVEIRLNGDLNDVTGLNNLTTIGGILKFDQNNSLADLTALANLTTLHALYVYDNSVLTSLNGLEGVTALSSHLQVTSNPMLGSLSGLDNLTSVQYYVSVASCNMLTDLQGLNALETIGSYVYIVHNNNLTSLEGLNNLTSIGESLRIENIDLESLSALSNLTYLGGHLELRYNNALTSLEGLHNVDFTDTDELEIFNNPLLELCSQENICDYILGGGAVTIHDNAPGCNSLDDLLTACFADLPHNNLVGRVLADTDPNCAADATEVGLAGWLVSVSSEEINYAVSTDSFGYYWLPVLDGDYTLNVVSPSVFWTSCFVDTLIQFNSFGDTITTDFFVQPEGDCPYLEWDVTLPPLRICQSRTVTVDYCNYGALPAEDAVFTVELDSLLTLESASIDYTVDGDGLIFFELPAIDLFECGQFTMEVFTDCDLAMIGDMPCIEVNLLSDALCAPDSLWDGSLITASGRCENDSIYFLLENIGTGDMLEAAQFRVEIVIDDIILMLEADDYQLPSGQTQMLAYAADGEGLRLEADQTPGHPLYTEVSAVVPNCEAMGTDSLLMQLPSMDGDPFSGTFCAPAVNSYDPNIKTAIPAGVGPEHLIDRDWPLAYTIQFQNTGNDVAYEVVIADTLSELLDLSTLDVKGASHDFTWTLTPERALTFTFADILLPDSTSNEPESHGYVSFTIEPVTDILPGNEIENTAHIYFDFNDAIVTNTVLHTIRKPVVATSERLDWCTSDLYSGQIISQDTTWQWSTSYLLYDSVHFVHFNVFPLPESFVALELPSGTYFEGVLLTVDTSFQLAYAAENGCDSLVNYTVSVITGTSSPLAFAQTHIYPNPTDDVLEVLHQVNALPQTWTLRNSLGELLWQSTLTPNAQLPPLRLRTYAAGVYYLEVRTREGGKVWKVFKI